MIPSGIGETLSPPVSPLSHKLGKQLDCRRSPLGTGRPPWYFVGNHGVFVGVVVGAVGVLAV